MFARHNDQTYYSSCQGGGLMTTLLQLLVRQYNLSSISYDCPYTMIWIHESFVCDKVLNLFDCHSRLCETW